MTVMNCVHDYGRRTLEGIARYGNAHGGWTLGLHHEAQVRQRLPRLDSDTRGIIAHAHSPRLMEHLQHCGVPVVNTSGVAPSRTLISVEPHNEAIGRMAAEHLLGLGHRRFICIAVKRWDYSVRRTRAFAATAESRGATLQTVSVRSWSRAEALIRDALAASATPVAVFAGSDGPAVYAVRQCLALGLAMPEQVAILGVDNDTLTTRMMSPTISSIEVPWEKLGFAAAERLNRLIQGQTVDPAPFLIDPTRVVTRQTTDGLALTDQDVVVAVKYIREHVAEPFSIAQVLEQVPLSRRALEQRFKRSLGRTLQTHITGVRLEQAKRLLTDTDYPIPEVAGRSGFGDAAYFATVFKKHTGQSPTAFRSAYRLS